MAGPGLLGGSLQFLKWLITKDNFRPVRIGLLPFQNGRTPWLINGGGPNHLLTGMILQAGVHNVNSKINHALGYRWIVEPETLASQHFGLYLPTFSLVA